MNEQPKKQINIILVILALIFVFPLGLFFMWKDNRFNKPIRIVISCFIAIVCISSLFSPKEPTETPVNKSIPEVAETTPSTPPTTPVVETTPQPQETEATPEPNTSAMVDYMTQKGKTDSETMTEEQKQEAINFIKHNFENYFKDNETMEKTMYYGALLQYGCERGSDLSNLGMNATQVVKYVYREVETIEDEATQINLRQVKKGLEKTGNLEKISLSEEQKTAILDMDKKIFQCLLDSEQIAKVLLENFQTVLDSPDGTTLDLYNLAQKAQEQQNNILYKLAGLSNDTNIDYINACELYVTNSKEIATNMLKYLDDTKPKYLSNIQDNLSSTLDYMISAAFARRTYLSDQGISDTEISALLDSTSQTE